MYVRNILKKIFSPIFIYEHRYMFSEIKKKHKAHLKEMLNKNDKSLEINDKKNWIRKLNKLTYCNPKFAEIGKAFASSDIKVIKDVVVDSDDIIAICVQKNDLVKLKRFISHHRKIGIDKFVILDNDSTDESIKYLYSQKDVILLQTKVPYTSNNRVGWINRILAHYGYNRWYLVADSDELLVYNNCENKNIKDVIKYIENNNIVRCRALMLDMYANSEYYSTNNTSSYYKQCKYFDDDTYTKKTTKYFDNISGGPRERIFKISPCLTKYPLFYFRKKDVFRAHLLHPCRDNLNSKCYLILKHYKFLPGEIEKYREIVKKENYYNGSIEYKHYLNIMKKKKNINFISENTREYKNSNSLNSIKIYDKIKWETISKGK